MRKFFTSLLLALTLALASLPLLGQGSAAPMDSTAFAPSLSWPATGLTLTYTNGTVYLGGTANGITGGTLTLTTNETNCAGPSYSACNIVYWPGSGSALAVTTTYATAAVSGNRILYLVTTSSGGNITAASYANLDSGGVIPAAYNDELFVVPPSSCWMTAATSAFTAGPVLTRAAANNQVLSGTLNTTAGTAYVDCDFSFEGRTTSGLGFQITSVTLLYGIQGAAMSSIAAATPASITYPAAGGAASGTVASVGGTLTVTPSSLQTSTTTAGQCYDENISFGTPFTLSNYSRFTLEQAFSNTTTATTLQICGMLVYGKWIQ
jgi:hypothetical protein